MFVLQHFSFSPANLPFGLSVLHLLQFDESLSLRLLEEEVGQTMVKCRTKLSEWVQLDSFSPAHQVLVFEGKILHSYLHC